MKGLRIVSLIISVIFIFLLCFVLFWDIEKGDVNKWLLAMDLFNVLVWVVILLLAIIDVKFTEIENDIYNIKHKIRKLQDKLNDIE